MPTDAQAEVLAALARGDRGGALVILMDAFGDDVYRLVRRMVGRTDLSDEVHQSVFVQAHRDLDSCRGNPRTWLYAIARHRCLDALKWHRRWRRRFVALEDEVDPAPRADERLLLRSEVDALERVLARLSPKVRLAVLLRYQEGLSFADMAAICGERPQTLQARVTRALPKLRRWLERMGVRDE